MRKLSLAAFAAFCIASVPAQAADPFYLGTWKFSAATLAPWHDAKRAADSKERARLMGKTIVLKAKDIDGPQPFPCKGPQYKLTDYTPDLIFQGAFEELKSKDKSIDPDKLAASLGFKDKKIKTLETGCEFDLHFVDEKTAEVGLNDYVYTLKKQ